MVMQRTATPLTPVRFRPAPPLIVGPEHVARTPIAQYCVNGLKLFDLNAEREESWSMVALESNPCAEFQIPQYLYQYLFLTSFSQS